MHSQIKYELRDKSHSTVKDNAAERKMIQELEKKGFYEDGMSFNDMKLLQSILIESEKESAKANKQNATLIRNLERKEALPTPFQQYWPRDATSYVAKVAATNLRCGQSSGNLQIAQKNKTTKLNMNPLSKFNNPKEKPLMPRYCSSDRQTRANEAARDSSDNTDKCIAQLCNHLLQITEINRNPRGIVVDSNFQWVKISETNGSYDEKIIDKKVTKGSIDEDNQAKESTSIVNETTRRPRIFTNKKAIYDYDIDSNEEEDKDDDNSDEDFELRAKRKKTVVSSSKKNPTSTRKTVKKIIEPILACRSENDTSIENKSDDCVTCIETSDECTITDEPPKKIQRNNSPEDEIFYPRRIVPPKPGGKLTDIRAKKPLLNATGQLRVKRKVETDNEEKSSILQTSGSNVDLREEENEKLLERERAVKDNEEQISISCDSVDIRPLRVSGRMKILSQRLAQIREKEKEDEIRHREREKMKEEAILQEKIERVQQRIREEKEKQIQQDRKDRLMAQRDEEWRALMAKREKKGTVERIELCPDGRSRNNDIKSDIMENNFTTNQSKEEFISDNIRDRESQPNHVQCPICSRDFTIDEIEAHAGACEEYDALPGISRSSSPMITPTREIDDSQRSQSSKLLECNICNKFNTNDGKQFQNHVDECLQHHKYGHSHHPDSIVEVPSSPIRTLRMISEQTDSEINYKSQFVVKTKSNKNPGKKRKRQ